MKTKKNQYFGVIIRSRNIIVEIYDNRDDAEKLASDYNRHDYEHYEVVRGINNIRNATSDQYSRKFIVNYANN